MKGWCGVVDCRIDQDLDNEYLTMNLWGKCVYEYPLEEILKCAFETCIILTDSEEIKCNVEHSYGNRFIVADTLDYDKYKNINFLIVSGRAPLIKSKTLLRAVKSYRGGRLCPVVCDRTASASKSLEVTFMLRGSCKTERNTFVIFDKKTETIDYFEVSLMEGTVVNNVSDFEQALILKKKELNAPFLREQILNRIEGKKHLFFADNNEGICLVGHSQIDFWNIDTIKGHKTRNCGIAGITSFEYYNDILEKGLLSCSEDIYLVMHGTNDIVYETDLRKVIDSISRTIDYIKERKPEASIYFLECIKVNGRIDRSNGVVDRLNQMLRTSLQNVNLIDTSSLNDDYGRLRSEYTKDGLHLSEKGYEVLLNIVEKAIDE